MGSVAQISITLLTLGTLSLFYMGHLLTRLSKNILFWENM